MNRGPAEMRRPLHSHLNLVIVLQVLDDLEEAIKDALQGHRDRAATIRLIAMRLAPRRTA